MSMPADDQDSLATERAQPPAETAAQARGEQQASSPAETSPRPPTSPDPWATEAGLTDTGASAAAAQSLIATLRADQRRRWQQGERVRVEEYLRQHPALQADAEGLLDLIYHEIVLQEQAEGLPPLEDYVQRFPQFASQLRHQFEVHRALATGHLFSDSLAPGQSRPAASATDSVSSLPTLRRGEVQPAPKGGPPVSGAAIHIRCPHCHNPILLADDRPDEILCPGCGSSFRIREASATETTTGTRPLGKFQLLARVGIGAFGAVWRARDTELDRIVALKIPHASLLASSSDLLRFQREARAAAQLRHPGIITVHEVQTLEGLPCLVSDFIEGVTLRSFLESRQLTFRETATLVADVAEALDYAHGMGLVHRDLKPANIMLDFGPVRLEMSQAVSGQPWYGTAGRAARDTASPSERLGRPLIMDFGLALREQTEITMTLDGQIIGTPAYMSPEQAAGRGHQADRRSDVYSLGVILYELLAGELPFRGSREMIIHQTLRDEPRPPRKLNQKIPRDLETICLKAMAKLPQQRYDSAGEMAADLSCFLKGEPIKARPIGSLARLVRWCARNPALAGTAAVAAAALLGVTGVSIALAVHQTRAAQRLQSETDSARAARDSAREAQDRAEAARQRAETERDRATWLEEVLIGRPQDPLSFEGPIPRIPRHVGTALRVEQILKRAQENSEIRFQGHDQAASRAAVLDAIGNAYCGLGMYHEAEERLKRALEIRKSLPPETRNQELATSYFNLGILYHCRALRRDLIDENNAQKSYQQALDLRRPVATDDDRLFEWKVLFQMAYLAIQQEEYARAAALFQECISRSKDDRQKLRARMGLGEANAEKDGTYGKDIPQLIQTAIAQVVADNGELKQAVTSLQEAVLGMYLADPLPTVLEPLRQRAFASAAAKLKEVYGSIEKLYPEPHLYKGVVLFFLADALQRGKDFRGAAAAYGDCLEIARQTVGLEQSKVPMIAAQRAGLLIRLGQKEAAQRLISEVMQAYENRYGKEHYFVANAMMTFADFYEGLHDHAAQAQLAGTALKIYDQTGGPKRRLYQHCRESLARATAARGSK